MLYKRPWSFPIPKTIPVVQRVPAKHRDKRESKKPQHQQDLEDRQIKFRDAKIADRGNIENGVESNHSHDDSFNRDVIGPKSDQNVHCDNLEWHKERHIEEKVPSHGKSKRIIYPLAPETDEGRRHRRVRDHLSEALVHCPHYGAPDEERDKEACGTSFREG